MTVSRPIKHAKKIIWRLLGKLSSLLSESLEGMAFFKIKDAFSFNRYYYFMTMGKPP